MADASKDHKGGLAKGGARNAGKKDGYWEFVAYEAAISSKISLITVLGRVLVGNPGMKAVLSYAEPQGTSPATLLLFLDVIQMPGNWPQRLTWAPCTYSDVAIGKTYTAVQITDGEISITVPLQ